MTTLADRTQRARIALAGYSTITDNRATAVQVLLSDLILFCGDKGPIDFDVALAHARWIASEAKLAESNKP